MSSTVITMPPSRIEAGSLSPPSPQRAITEKISKSVLEGRGKLARFLLENRLKVSEGVV